MQDGEEAYKIEAKQQRLSNKSNLHECTIEHVSSVHLSVLTFISTTGMKTDLVMLPTDLVLHRFDLR